MNLPVILNDLSYVRNSLRKDSPLFVDTETCFLYKGIRLIQMFQEGWSHVAVFDSCVVGVGEVFELIEDAHVVFHNYAYDAACFIEDLSLKANPFKTFDDTLLLSRITFVEKDSFSLDSCYSYVYGIDVYAQFGIDKKEMQRSFLTTKRRNGATSPLSDIQIQYASADVYYMPKLWNAVKEGVCKEHYKVDREFLSNSLRWQRNGLPIDRELRDLEYSNVLNEIEVVSKELPQSLNVNSFIQVRNFLGVEASAKDDLLALQAGGSSPAGNILKKRKLLKLKNFLERYDHPRIKGYFSPTTISGRVRCDGGDEEGTDNLLQIPRKLKAVFGFHKDDPRFLVYCDYAQLELRTACCNTGEKVIEEIFRKNLDLHTYTATKMFPDLTYDQAKNDKIKRHAAKTCNFSLLYCGSAKSLKDAFLRDGGVTLTLDQAADYRSSWLEVYPAFKKWHRAAVDKFKKNEMICTTKNGRSYKAKLFTDICGVENQSLGADAAKKALNIFLQREPEAKVLCFIHDAIVVEARSEDEAKRLSHSLGLSMLAAWFDSIKFLDIADLPMPLEVNYGKNLATIENENVGWATKGDKVDLLKFQETEAEGARSLKFQETKIEESREYRPEEELMGRDVLFDADTIFYIASLENEKFEDALTNVREYFNFVRKVFNMKSMSLFLTSGKCFRYDLYPQYKANRNREATPPCLHKLKEYCIKNFKNVFSDPLFEADDLIVSAKKSNPTSLIFAVDKDVLNSVEGRHFNYKKREIIEVSKERAVSWPYFQAIVGDSSDNIPGAAGLGPKKAVPFLEGLRTDYDLWGGVVRAFKSRGAGEEDALLSMRLVNMHQCENGRLSLYKIPVKGV